ncbi:SusC/RagA family TonB-linked outer membrane protein [Niabella ginsenosidivorans]|nr:SusC/RagA family TonB-linked outer membrane protein [Niabella ginsenosidivorans]
MKKRRFLLKGTICFPLFMILFLYSAGASAQEHSAMVSGVVRSDSGQVLSGVSVIARNKETGMSSGAVTNEEGVFSFTGIPVNGSYTFTFSRVGYNDYTTAGYQLKAGESTTINVTLKTSSNTLNEVVVVAFGTKQRATLIESVTQVDDKIIKGRPVNNVVSALQGQVAGLSVLSSSGQPGIAPSFNIRGTGSIYSNTTPLVIVDGVPGSITMIDPNDIESISVLKDAAAASLYGALSANGVILVTTKKGKLGKIAISYSGYVGWQKPTELFKEANAYNYANAFNEATMYDLLTPSNINFDSSKMIFTLDQLNGWKSGTIASSDWRKTLFNGNNGFTQSHYINLGGGLTHEDLTLKSNFSFGYLQQNGNVANTDYKRYSIRSNNELKWKRLTTGLSVGLVMDDRNEPSSKAVGDFGAIVSAINRQRPVDSIRLWDGSWNITSTNDTRNPVRQAVEGGYYNPKNYNIQVNFNVAYDLAKDLTLKYTTGLSYNLNEATQFQNQLAWYNGTTTGPNVSTMSNYSGRRNLQQLDLSYAKNIQKHHMDAIVGVQQDVYNYRSTTLSRSNFSNNNSNSMQLGDPSSQTNNSSQYKWILEGVFGRFNYDYDKKYMAELNFREDASSRLNPSTNTDFFPSAAVGWRPSEEPFWAGLKDVLPEFKIKASYGALGNANVASYTNDNNTQYYSYNSIIGNVYSNGLGYNLASVFDGTINSAFTLIQNPNNKLRWERTTLMDIAIDGSVLTPRLTYTIDYFNKRTNRMLFLQPVSDINGVTPKVGVGTTPTYVANVGSMYNRGIEVAVGYSNRSERGLGYSLNGNYTYLTNKILDVGDQNIPASGVTKYTVGYPLNAYYLYVNDGLLTKDEFVNQSSKDPILPGQKWGDQRIKDISNDGSITAADRVMINKSGTPKHLFGLNFDLNYRGFGIGGMLQGAADYYKYLGASVGYGFNSGYSITNWTIENSYNPVTDADNYNTRLPRVSKSNSINNTYPSTFFLFNSSYVRLKNLQVYYDLQAGTLQRLHMKSFRIYASGQNLFTWSKLPRALGIDPEISSPTAGYPLVVIYTIGVNVSF